MMARNNTYKLRSMPRKRFCIKNTIREIRATTIQRLLLCTIRIHVHYKARKIMCQIRIFPTSIHDTAIIHNCRSPVCILIKSQSTQRTVFRIIKAHITYFIITIYTRYTIISNIGHCNKLTGR